MLSLTVTMKITHLLIYRVRGRNLDFKNSKGEQDLLPSINNGSSLPDPVDWLNLLDNIDDSNSDNYSADEKVWGVFPRKLVIMSFLSYFQYLFSEMYVLLAGISFFSLISKWKLWQQPYTVISCDGLFWWMFVTSFFCQIKV